ncbi:MULTISPECIES: C40 family peptidase [unclassified Nocardia]|uniref:C40 family peptidase n=1 Tax=unclassified Nocardia TaxID=2637762 RepID=UPI001CE4AF78|nr:MULTISPECIES: C40 family peptidase [unclassified Nocardia]
MEFFTGVRPGRRRRYMRRAVPLAIAVGALVIGAEFASPRHADDIPVAGTSISAGGAPAEPDISAPPPGGPPPLPPWLQLPFGIELPHFDFPPPAAMPLPPPGPPPGFPTLPPGPPPGLPPGLPPGPPVGLPVPPPELLPPGPPPAPVVKSAREIAFEVAHEKIGSDYVYGATGPDAFDCSGLVQWAYRQAGVDIPRTSYEQRYAGDGVPVDEILPGDMVSYYGGSHSAIYAGNGRVIHASTEGVGVIESPLFSMPIAGVRRF